MSRFFYLKRKWVEIQGEFLEVVYRKKGIVLMPFEACVFY